MALKVNQLNSSNRYEITDTEQGYQFITETGVIYFINFITYPPVSELFPVRIYMFNIDRFVPENLLYKGSVGNKVRNTVIHILEVFFYSSEEALITICDIDDGRQKIRKRLFDTWFNLFNKGRLYRLDTECLVDGCITYASLYFSQTSYDKELWKEEFKKLAEIQFYNDL